MKSIKSKKQTTSSVKEEFKRAENIINGKVNGVVLIAGVTETKDGIQFDGLCNISNVSRMAVTHLAAEMDVTHEDILVYNMYNIFNKLNKGDKSKQKPVKKPLRE